MSGESDRLDVTVIVGEFASSARAMEAFQDLSRWVSRGDRGGISAYRLSAPDHGSFRLVVAVVLTASGQVDTIIRRLKRKGGRLSDIPQPDKLALVERALGAMDAGVSDERRGLPRPLDGPPPDPTVN